MRKIGALCEFRARLQSVLHSGRGKLKSTVDTNVSMGYVKRQPGIHQRHSDCGAFYPQDPVLVRSNRNRRQHGARRRGIGAMPGSMSALPEPSSQEFSPLIFHWEHVSLEQEGWLRQQENATTDAR